MADEKSPPSNYLEGPRINFAGEFWANVPTVNNMPEYFKFAKLPKAEFLQMMHNVDQDMGWPMFPNFNTHGGGEFLFSNCYIRGAVDADSQRADTALQGWGLKTVTNNPHARASRPSMVDLDPDFNMVNSVLFGMRVQVVNGVVPVFEGDFDPQSVQFIWWGALDVTGSDKNELDSATFKNRGARGVFSSVLHNVRILERDALTKYPFLGRFFGSTVHHPDETYTLKMKFTIGNYRYHQGKLGGDIGGFLGIHPSETYPKTMLIGRHLFPQTLYDMSGPPTTCFGKVEAYVGEDCLVVDWSNALPKTSDEGHYSDCFQNLYIQPVGKRGMRCPLLVEHYAARDKTFMKAEGSISRYLLTPEVVEVYNSNMLVIMDDESRVLASEYLDSDGLYIQAEPRWVRMQCGWVGDDVYPVGDSTQVRVYPMQYGKLLDVPEAKVESAGEVSKMNTLNSGLKWEEVNQEKKLNIQQELMTDGSVVLTIATPTSLKMSNGKPPRSDINLDSLLFQVDFGIVRNDGVSFWSNMTQILIQYTLPILIHVFDAPDPLDGPPTWEGNIEEVMNYFNNLYPVMEHRGLDLSSKEMMTEDMYWVNRVIQRMSLGYYDAGYMPVTRDLAPSKRQMILNYLRSIQNFSV